ncbi:MAG TPA: hypothetical protein VK909_10330, partial [Anaerolineales bacterium]|nr:hypothetical protein [Anaerolineales bacterium]
MNLSRFICILTVLSAFTTLVHGQQQVQAVSNSVTALNVTEKAEPNRGAGAANLFARASAPLLETINAGGSDAKQPQANPADQWHFQFTPYLWIVGVSGRAGLGSLAVDVNTGVTDSDIQLNFGFMGTFEARKKRIVILTDLQFSSLGTDRPSPGPLFSGASADFKTFILEPQVGYRIFDNPEKEAFFGVLGGVRYWHLKTDLTLNAGVLPGVTASRSRGWVDGVAGVRGKTNLTPRFFVTGEADLGGGGSNLTYHL